MRVLQSARAIRPTTNPYIAQLFASLEAEGIEVIPFTWREALFGRYDVFHLHWPEYLARNSNPAISVLSRVLLGRLLRRLSRERVAVVQTRHNSAPHDRSTPSEEVLLSTLASLVRVTILLREPVGGAGPHEAVILHGHYRDTVERSMVPRDDHRIGFFGLVRPYKGVETLISAFSAANDPALTLAVEGRAVPADYARELEALAESDPRVALRFEYLSEAELSDSIARSVLVVFPYRQFENSGAAILALSLGRPILVPRADSTDALVGEFGARWVQQFTGDLTPEVLISSVASARALDETDEPAMPLREWALTARSHREVYERALAGEGQQ